MPEILEDVKEETTVKPAIKPVTAISTISGVVLSALLTWGVTEKADRDAYQAKIENSKYEICAPIVTPETITETLKDTVIAGDTVTLTDTIITPERREYFRSIALGYLAPQADTIIVTYTRTRGDTILYYGVYPMEAGDCIRGDVNVDKMN